eukprot:TRINITY_DN3233_c0_g1_i2.p1 TRINITY_DN3233_c0_g1~~TRINITY_DN3233_c0_g1_i2.p1  ORF type:complete len:251 (+),score=55.12 TRINITY_DN3233_c0_g1_i2:121-873(+)
MIYRNLICNCTMEEVKHAQGLAELVSYSEVKKKLKAEYGTSEPTSEQILSYIKENKLEENILREIVEEDEKVSSVTSRVNRSAIQKEDLALSNAVQLRVRVLQGKNFIDYENVAEEKTLICDIVFMDRRFVTRPVKCSLTPLFDETFVIKFKDLEDKFKLENLAVNECPLHFAIVEEHRKTKKRNLLGVKRVKWRDTLHARSIEQDAVFNSMDFKRVKPLGTLTVCIDALFRFNWTWKMFWSKTCFRGKS